MTLIKFHATLTELTDYTYRLCDAVQHPPVTRSPATLAHVARPRRSSMTLACDARMRTHAWTPTTKSTAKSTLVLLSTGGTVTHDHTWVRGQSASLLDMLPVPNPGPHPKSSCPHWIPQASTIPNPPTGSNPGKERRDRLVRIVRGRTRGARRDREV